MVGRTKTHVAASKVASLKHELRDHSVELGSFVAKSVLASTKMLEIFAGVGSSLVEQFKVDTSGLVCLG